MQKNIAVALFSCFLTAMLIVLPGCRKSKAEAGDCIEAKWQLVAKSGDGMVWQNVLPGESHTLLFSGAHALSYNDNSISCSGSYTLTADELVTDLSACSAGIYFSHHIVQQTANTLVLRPNSGAILPYTKYVKVH
jgi:hypothetical protein